MIETVGHYVVWFSALIVGRTLIDLAWCRYRHSAFTRKRWVESITVQLIVSSLLLVAAWFALGWSL